MFIEPSFTVSTLGNYFCSLIAGLRSGSDKSDDKCPHVLTLYLPLLFVITLSYPKRWNYRWPYKEGSAVSTHPVDSQEGVRDEKCEQRDAQQRCPDVTQIRVILQNKSFSVKTKRGYMVNRCGAGQDLRDVPSLNRSGDPHVVGRGSGLLEKGIFGISHVVRNQVKCSFKACSHQAKSKKIKEQSEEIKEKNPNIK